MHPNDHLTNSVFQKSWWLEAVAPGAWDIIEIEKGGEVFARLPYVMEKKAGVNMCTMPPFTQVMGPWIKELPGKHGKQLSKEKELMKELIDRLPSFDYFKQRFHYSITNWLPFYWEGFQQTTKYTYVLEDISNPDQIWEDLAGNIRREIKKAEELVDVGQVSDSKLMWQFHSSNFDNDVPEGNFELFNRIHDACVEQESSAMFTAKTKDGEVISALYMVYDDNAAYYLFGGTKDEHKNTGAFSLLMFEAIKFAASKTNRFDFEGSMIESIERFYRGFGGIQKPYFHITKANKKVEFLLSMKKVFQ